jgi:methylated-DNA-[protein]-cysteine S-methyltransferase
MRYTVVDTPIGTLTIASTSRGVAAVRFGASLPKGVTSDESANRECISQLREYFEGKRTDFDLPLDLEGTPFQMSVWKELAAIPYGQTRSYGDIARSIGKPGAARAVGMANHNNPVALVIPCHRVVGRDGSLTGYGGGLHVKEALLSLEHQDRTLFT